MRSLTIIYWTRVLLGAVAALISTLLSIIVGPENITLFNGITIALLLYIVSYYVYKPLFLAKVDKPQKIFTMGIFAYFLTWLVAWTILNTTFLPHP